jgi:hypothetical protein
MKEANTNIVILSDFERSRKGMKPGESILLDECRELAASRLSGAISGMFDRATEELFELAEKAALPDLQNLYLDAMSLARDNRGEIEAAFRNQFVTGFNREVRGDKRGGSTLELSLVSPDDLEESLAVTDIANKLADDCGKELFALDKRIGALLHDPELDYSNNPLGPEAIGHAFMEGLKQFGAGVKVKLILVMLFNKHLPERVLTMYEEINRYLADEGVLPKIRGGLRKSAPPAGSAGRQAMGHGGSHYGGVETANPQGPVKQEVFDLLRQLMGGVAGGGVPSVAGAGGFSGLPGIPGAGGDAAMGKIPAVAPVVLSALTSLQHGNVDGIAASGAAWDPSLLAKGTVNVLRELKSTSIVGNMGQLDAMTLDIVAMLFDYILDDKNIPDAMKALIGRLQIPVLKVAMLDKKFFSHKSHPARKFVDSLAQAAIGWNAEDEDGLYGKAEALVQRILNEFDEKTDLFDEVLADLEGFLAEQEKKALEVAERSARVIHDRERVEIAALMARTMVQRRSRNESVPQVIRAFIVQWWQPVLREAYVAQGEDGEAWSGAVATMDGLIWSVEPKHTAEERKKLVGQLPGLLRQIQHGMNQVEMPGEAREAFFSALVKCHTRAVKAGLANGGQTEGDVVEPSQDVLPVEPWGTSAELGREGLGNSAETIELQPVDVPDDVAPVSMGVDETFKQSFDLDGQEVEELTISDVAWEASVDNGEDEYDAMVRRLKRGVWVEFDQEDGTVLRNKLAWVSPLQGVYLFTNRLGLRAASISPQGLGAKFRNGTARIVDQVPLVDRAVNNLMEGLTRQVA